jgi:uncharacterized 2Fe-2S/4Fe-4S cluster protein (DUF4445 family)
VNDILEAVFSTHSISEIIQTLQQAPITIVIDLGSNTEISLHAFT